MTKATHAAAVETPQSKNDPTQVKVEEIPLPPESLWAELENSTAAKNEPEATETAVPVRHKFPYERLEFVKNAEVTIPLQFPFVRGGATISALTLRRLTVGEVGDVIDTLPDTYDNYDIYAFMCGQPATVLRGLVDVDGAKVAEVGYDFLPQLFRGETAVEIVSESS